jgi:glycopeptide antibiotics resistance protein
MHPFRFAKFWLTVGWLLVALVVFLSLWPEPPQPLDFAQSDKFAHVIAYIVLMLWFANIYPLRPHHLRLSVGFLAMGISLELLQGLSAHRTFSYIDIVANGFGILIGLALAKTHLSTCLFRLDTWLLRLGSRIT